MLLWHRHVSSDLRDYRTLMFSLAGATLLPIAEEHNGLALGAKVEGRLLAMAL